MLTDFKFDSKRRVVTGEGDVDEDSLVQSQMLMRYKRLQRRLSQ